MTNTDNKPVKKYRNEMWASIEKVDGRYWVSDLGRIKSIERRVLAGYGRLRIVKEKIRKLQINNYGYLFICVKHKKRSTILFPHIEVAKSFVSNNDNKPEVNHKDGNPSNNNYKNLEWVTRSENILHSYRILGRKSALAGLTRERHPMAIKVEAVNIKTGKKTIFGSQLSASEKLGVSKSHIYLVMNNKSLPTKGYNFKKVI